MKKLLLITLLGYSIMIVSCKGQSCYDLPTDYSTYSMAVDAVKTASFQIEDSFNSDSWIRKGSYFSCDGENGFLIIKMERKSKEYIYKNVEYSVWKNFKESDSKGEFYNQYLKGEKKYSFRLN